MWLFRGHKIAKERRKVGERKIERVEDDIEKRRRQKRELHALGAIEREKKRAKRGKDIGTWEEKKRDIQREREEEKMRERGRKKIQSKIKDNRGEEI